MIIEGKKIILSGQYLDATGDSILAPSLEISFKIIHGLKDMIHPGLKQAKFTGVESPIDLSIFMGLPKLTDLQFIDCLGLNYYVNNFSAMADLLQSGVKVEVLTSHNQGSTDLSSRWLTPIFGTSPQEIREHPLIQQMASMSTKFLGTTISLNIETQEHAPRRLSKSHQCLRSFPLLSSFPIRPVGNEPTI
ncbi:hypothetical protein [unidentified bacterial endosymbiont]|uniref:hypothetical protein n=1 Tax=unidentified bacterial endosymbiont TaxID=2355 RepID=UPI00209E782D|nr:hypothetical protein [unidentified bacterial endosymbiont]